MGKLNIGFLITVAAVIAVLIVLFLAAYLLVPDPARVKDTLGVMQAVVTTLAIVLGGVSPPISGRYSGNPNRT